MTHKIASGENFDIVRGNETVRMPFAETEPQSAETNTLATEAYVLDAIGGVSSKPTRIYNAVGSNALADKGQLFDGSLESGGHFEVDGKAGSYYLNGVKFVMTSNDSSTTRWDGGRWFILYYRQTGEIKFYAGDTLTLSPVAPSGKNPTNTAQSAELAGLYSFGTSETAYYYIRATYVPQSVQINSTPYAHFALESLPDREYSSSSTYAVGDLVKYRATADDPYKAYRCTTAITTAENWTAAHWTEIRVLADKADKISSPTNGNIVTMDADGNLTNSGKNFDDIVMPDNVVNTTGDQTIGGSKEFTDELLAAGVVTTNDEGSVCSWKDDDTHDNWGISKQGIYYGKDADYSPQFDKDEDNKGPDEGEIGWNKIATLTDVNDLLVNLMPGWTNYNNKRYAATDVCVYDGCFYECIESYQTSAASNPPPEDDTHWESRRLDELFLATKGGTLRGDLRIVGAESSGSGGEVNFDADEGSITASGDIKTASAVKTDTIQTAAGQGSIIVPPVFDQMATWGDIGLKAFSPIVQFGVGELVIYGEDEGSEDEEPLTAEVPALKAGSSDVPVTPVAPDYSNYVFGIYKCNTTHLGDWNAEHFTKVIDLVVDSEPTAGSTALLTSGAVAEAISKFGAKPTHIWNTNGSDALDDKGGLHDSILTDSFYTIKYNGGFSTRIAPLGYYEAVSGVPHKAYCWYFGAGPSYAGQIAYDPIDGVIYDTFYYGTNQAVKLGDAPKGLDPNNEGVVLPDLTGVTMKWYGTCDLKFTPKQISLNEESYGRFALEGVPSRTIAANYSYAVGDLLGDDGKAYRCKVAYTSAASDPTAPHSDTTHWTEIPVLGQKQDKLVVGVNLDDAPVQDSTNPITSGAVAEVSESLTDEIGAVDRKVDETATALEAEIELRAPHVPFAICPVFDTGDSDSDAPDARVGGVDAGDSSEAPVPWGIYLPKGSLYVNGQEVEVEGVEEDFYPIAAGGEFYCSITLGGSFHDESSESSDESTESSSSDSSEEYHPDYSKATDGALYAARIVTEPPEDDLFHFKVGELKSMDEAIVSQIVRGSVQVTVPNRVDRIPFHIYEFTLDDEVGARTVYGMYTPADGTLKINKSTYRIKEAEGAWVWLDFDPYADGLYKYFCWYNEGEAHVGTYSQKMRRAELSFPVATIAVGNGNHGDKGDGENTQKSSGGIHAVVAGVGPSKIGPERPAGDVDVQAWSDFLNANGAEQVTTLKNEQATVSSVLAAFGEACSHPDGLAILFVCGHGNCEDGNNTIQLYDDLLHDTQIWNVVKSAKGKVWLLFDACMSGSMYGPPDVEESQNGESPLSSAKSRAPARSMAESMRLLAEGEPSADVQMLCWSAATDDSYAWGLVKQGGFFTRACMRHLATNMSYTQAWAEVSGDEELSSNQIPQQTVMGESWAESNVLEAPPAEETGDGRCYTGDGGYAPLPVIVKQRASGLMFILNPNIPAVFSESLYELQPLVIYEIQATVEEKKYIIYVPQDIVEYDDDYVPVYDEDGEPVVNQYVTVNEGDYWIVIVQNSNTGENEAHICQKEDIPADALAKVHLGSIDEQGNVKNCLHTGVVSIQPPKVAGLTLNASGVFAPVYDTAGEDPTIVTGFTNCYYQVGGYTCQMADQNTLPGNNGIVCVKVVATGSSRSATLDIYPTLADVQTAQHDLDYVITPLYVMQDCKIVADLRSIPTAQMMEVL